MRRRSVLVALATTTLFAASLSVQIGDWKDQPKTLGWSVFNTGNEPFDPADNLAYCDRRSIRVRPRRSKDASGAINAALLKLRASGGGTVKLDVGVYTVTTHIRLPSYTCLIGAGMNATTIKLAKNAPKWKNSGVVRSRRSERITVSDLTIDGNKDNQLSRDIFGGAYGRFGFYSELTNYVYLRRVAAVHNQGYGFDPHGSKTHWAYYLLLDGCVAEDNALDGFTLDQTLYVALLNSVTVSNARHGVNLVTGTRYCRVYNTTARDNGFESRVGCNMMAQDNQNFGTRHVHFVRNSLVNGMKAGLCVNNVRDVAYERNVVDNPKNVGFCYHLVKSRATTLRASSCNAVKKTRVLRTHGAKYRFIGGGDIGTTKLSARTRSFGG